MDERACYDHALASGCGSLGKNAKGGSMRKAQFLLVVMLLLASGAVSQNNTDWVKTTTPKLLSISVEQIKNGQESAHAKIETGWRRAFEKANYPSYFLGLSSLTGPPVMLFLTGFDSLQSWQKEDEDQSANAWLWAEQDKLHMEDSNFVQASSHEFGELVPESSVPAKFPLGAARCFSVTRLDVEPSRQREFRDWLRRQIGANTSALPHIAAYRLMAGGSLSSFVLIEARTSRADFDSNRIDFETLIPGVLSVTRNFFEPNPNTSRVTAEFAKGNEKFWFPSER